jgi:hypothetical protein
MAVLPPLCYYPFINLKEKVWKRKKERKKTTQKEMMSSHTADVVASISTTKDQLATKDIVWIVVKVRQ